MKYNFDKETDRSNTNSVKWEYIQNEEMEDIIHTDQFFGEDRKLPMWVADMDFPVPKPVVDALVARAQHSIFGYTVPGNDYFQSVVRWIGKRYSWEISPKWILNTPGVVPAIKALVRTFVPPGEQVIIQPPVYYPFNFAIEKNQGVLAFNPLKYENHRYTMDFADLAQKAKDPQVKMAILCSPHNPVGRVWSEEELTRFGEICLENDVLVVADEIHCDLLFEGAEFTPFAAISKEFAQNAVICTAGSKTFNLAGLKHSNIIIPNKNLREQFGQTLVNSGLGGVNIFGMTALEAAYNHGEEWLEQLLTYLDGNLRYMEEYIAENIPQITIVKPEGTYLVWLDCREMGLSIKELKHLMVKEAGVYMDEGYIFGPEGEGFERINIACPRSILADALERIKEAVDRL